MRLQRTVFTVTMVVLLINPASAFAYDWEDAEFSAVNGAKPNEAQIQVSSTVTSESSRGTQMRDQTGESVVMPDGRTVRLEVTTGKPWCDRLYKEVLSSHPCDRFRPTEPEEEEESEPGVDPLRVLYTAVASARIDGAGIVVEPGRDWVWMGVPTLAHAQGDTVETSVQVFDLNVPVTFRATRFVFDFHDGNPPVISSVPGAPYPDMTIQGVYPAVSERMFVTLTTTWDATVTHPITGQELTVPGALRTVEDSRVFEVVRPKQRLISDREFGKNR